jgi:hypothetical protein
MLQLLADWTMSLGRRLYEYLGKGLVELDPD